MWVFFYRKRFGKNNVILSDIRKPADHVFYSGKCLGEQIEKYTDFTKVWICMAYWANCCLKLLDSAFLFWNPAQTWISSISYSLFLSNFSSAFILLFLCHFVDQRECSDRVGVGFWAPAIKKEMCILLEGRCCKWNSCFVPPFWGNLDVKMSVEYGFLDSCVSIQLE